LPADAGVTMPATAVLSDGRISVSGAVTTVEEGRALLTTAAVSVGTAQVQSTLVVNPAVAAQPPVTLDVAQDIRFAFDSAEVLPDYAAALDVQARLLTSQPGATITIAAFTDAIGSDTYNHELSLQRAQAVADHLIARGVDPHQIVIQALGEADPVGDNTSPEGRQLNRRVETRLDGALG
jgi:outer membrane protein OmpA-like peptidoglycan-associated protein